MKKKINKFLILVAQQDLLWQFLKPISKLGLKLNSARKRHERAEKEKDSSYYSLFTSLTVLNGPFKGMKYPSMSPVGSMIFPKLLGSYERELHPVLKEFATNNYSEIIDVGCAEGYYAVGMSMHHKNAKVYAYDTNKDARKLCSNMAKLNGVSDHLEIRSTLTPDLLGSFNFSTRGLIICDCEGFENELFNVSNLENLKNCDLIIETHDFRNMTISTNLKELFKSTHSLQSIYSIDDVQKALTYDFTELTEFSLDVKRHIMRENRQTIMEWLICRPKT